MNKHLATQHTAPLPLVRRAILQTLSGREVMAQLADLYPSVNRPSYVALGSELLSARAKRRVMRIADSFAGKTDPVVEDRFIKAWYAIHDPGLHTFAAQLARKFHDARRNALTTQKNQTPRITFELLYQHGITLEFDTAYMEPLQHLYQTHAGQPLFSQTLSWKAFASPTFGDVAPNYVHIYIHDLIDHFLIVYLQTFRPYRDGRTMRQLYNDLHTRFGNPLTTNYPELKGEPWAHPGHAWRESHLPYASASHTSIDDLKRILTRSKHPTENQRRVLHELDVLPSSKSGLRTIATLCFMYESCIEVLQYQSIVYGPLYDLDDHQELMDKFTANDPEYLCFIYDTLMLCSVHRSTIQNAIDVVHVILESYLRQVANGAAKQAVTITVSNMLTDAGEFDAYGMLGPVQAARWQSANWTLRTLKYKHLLAG